MFVCVFVTLEMAREREGKGSKGKNSFRSNESERLYQPVRGIDCSTNTHKHTHTEMHTHKQAMNSCKHQPLPQCVCKGKPKIVSL